MKRWKLALVALTLLVGAPTLLGPLAVQEAAADETDRRLPSRDFYAVAIVGRYHVVVPLSNVPITLRAGSVFGPIVAQGRTDAGGRVRLQVRAAGTYIGSASAFGQTISGPVAVPGPGNQPFVFYWY